MFKHLVVRSLRSFKIRQIRVIAPKHVYLWSAHGNNLHYGKEHFQQLMLTELILSLIHI